MILFNFLLIGKRALYYAVNLVIVLEKIKQFEVTFTIYNV